ncbi:uncharacterized protein LOC129602752 [Paramacrobiotus metropolitanus]|uniref:uncharacterized protein LOC129602752 n=1 Tax=Paramacrobiotus metropolitanus TaxID=2943436 RepID=UPI0024457FE8|nr:uncharacterized protein LOC129602752 [Paramacrobiotus metropolitanus]
MEHPYRFCISIQQHVMLAQTPYRPVMFSVQSPINFTPSSRDVKAMMQPLCISFAAAFPAVIQVEVDWIVDSQSLCRCRSNIIMILHFRIPFTTPFSQGTAFRISILYVVAGALATCLQTAVYTFVFLYEAVYDWRGNLVLARLPLGLLTGLCYTGTAYLLRQTSRHLARSPYHTLSHSHVRRLQSLCATNMATSLLLLAMSAYLLIPLSEFIQGPQLDTIPAPSTGHTREKAFDLASNALGVLLVHAGVGFLAAGMLLVSGCTLCRCPLPPPVVLPSAPMMPASDGNNQEIARDSDCATEPAVYCESEEFSCV